MGMQTPVTDARLDDARLLTTQRHLLMAAWAMAALLAVLVVAVVVQGARIADLETAVQQSTPSEVVVESDTDTWMKLDEMCRLLGAVAQKDGVAVATLFDGETMTTCEAAAGAGASAVRDAG